MGMTACNASPPGSTTVGNWLPAPSSDPDRARASAAALHVSPDRAYGSFAEITEPEAVRADPIDAVAVVTPNHLHAAISNPTSPT